MSVPGNRYARVLTAVLLLEGAAFYAVASRAESAPLVGSLGLFPHALGGWTVARDVPIEQEVQDVLRADDTLNRVYVNSSQTDYAFFVYRVLQDAAVWPGAALSEELSAWFGLGTRGNREADHRRSRLERAHCDEPVCGGARRRQERGVVLVPNPQPHHCQ